MKFLPLLIFFFSSLLFGSEDLATLLHFNFKEKKETYNLSFEDFRAKECRLNKPDTSKLPLVKSKSYQRDKGLYLYASNNYSNANYYTFGIRWNLFENGLYSNKNLAKINHLQYELEKLKIHKDQSKIYYPSYNFIIYFYNEKKIALINDFLKYLQIKLDLYQDLFYKKLATIDEVYAVKEEFDNIKQLLDTYVIYNTRFRCTKELEGDIQLFDLSFDTIEKALKTDPSYKQQIDILKQITELKNDRYKDWRLDVLASTSNRNNADFNLRFNLLIPLTPKKYKELEKTENLINQKKIESEIAQKELYLQKNFYVYRYKLNQYINFYNKIQYTKLQLHRAQLRYKLHIENPIDNLKRIMSNISSIYSTQLQLLDIKQQLLLQAYSLLYFLDLPFKNSFIHPIQIDTHFNLHPGKRGLFIWANGFKKYPNNLLITFLKQKNIKKVYISITKHQDLKKLQNFLSMANKEHIKTFFLLPYGIYPKKTTLPLERVNIFLEKEPKDGFAFLNKFHKKFPKTAIEVTTLLPKKLKFPKFIHRVYNTSSDIPVIDINKYHNEAELEQTIKKLLETKQEFLLYEFKPYLKFAQ